MLVGLQIATVLRPREGAVRTPWRLRDIALPFAAGLALLAYLGVGDVNANVDILAHGLGMAVGLATGFFLAWTHLPEKTPCRFQKLLACAALLLPVLAWLWALGSR